MVHPTNIAYHRDAESGIWWFDSPDIPGMGGGGRGDLDSARVMAHEAVQFAHEDDTAAVGVETYEWTDERTGAVITTTGRPVGI